MHYSKDSKRSIDFHFRLPRELEEKLEMYREKKHHPSLSHTFKYFLKLGIKSTELLEELKDNPSKKDDIVKEWESSLKFMISGDAVEDEIQKISDEDLETVVMIGYCELIQRKRKMKRQEFQTKEYQISNHVESYMENRIGDNSPQQNSMNV